MDNNSQDKNKYIFNADSPSDDYESGGNSETADSGSGTDEKPKKNVSVYDSESEIVFERRKIPSDKQQSAGNGNQHKRVVRTETGSTNRNNGSEQRASVQSAKPRLKNSAENDSYNQTMIYDTVSTHNGQDAGKDEESVKIPQSIPVHRTKIQSSLKPKQNQEQTPDKSSGDDSESVKGNTDRVFKSIPYETKVITRSVNRQSASSSVNEENPHSDIPDKAESLRDTQKKSLIPVSVKSDESTKVIKVRSEADKIGMIPGDRIQDDEIDILNKNAKEKKALAKRRRRESGEGASTVLSVVWAIMYIVLVVVVSLFLGFGIIFIGNDIFAFVKEDVLVTVEIPEYATLNEVTDILYEEGLIKYKMIFKIWANLRDKDNISDFLAGTYTMSPSMNYDEMRAEIRPRMIRSEIRITIPEGYTTDEIIDLFVAKGIGTREGYIEVINNFDFTDAGYDYWFLDDLEIDGYSSDRFYRLDGYLFPDTYDFYSDSSEKVVIAKLLDNFKVKFNSTYAARAAELGMTVDEIITLASLVEKEGKFVYDLADISSVFHNRIKYKAYFPKFESDASIIYAIHHDTGVRPKSLDPSDVYYSSPYNTYTNDGLPPGPIANPGLEAIKYTLYPNETDYFYFVSDINGKVYYAATKQLHDSNTVYARSVLPSDVDPDEITDG